VIKWRGGGETGRLGDWETGRHGGMVAWWHGGGEAGRRGDRETGRLGGMVAWWHGGGEDIFTKPEGFKYE